MSTERPEWWPKCPYPEIIFPGAMDEFVAAIPDDELRTHLTGIVGREYWGICEGSIFAAWTEQIRASRHRQMKTITDERCNDLTLYAQTLRDVASETDFSAEPGAKAVKRSLRAIARELVRVADGKD